MTDTYEQAIDGVLDAIVADYKRWCDGARISNSMDKSWRVKHSKVYSKIIEVRDGKDSSVWGFVVHTTEHKKFKQGDILMSASWKTPATNHARGNIFDGFSGVTWTGAAACGSTAQSENEARAKMQPELDALTSL